MGRIFAASALLLALSYCQPGCDSSGSDGSDANFDVCTPDQKECDGNQVMRCEDDGASLELVETCQYGCDQGACLPKPVCTPSCEGKTCGPDGCGGTCGSCEGDFLCSNGACVNPDALCEQGEQQCEASDLMTCAEDGMSWKLLQTCPWGCDDAACNPEPRCQPLCDGKQCGDDGCQGSCGECDEGLVCDAGVCAPPQCTPECGQRECGDDTCGGSCGLCPQGFTCDDLGACQPLPGGTVTGSLVSEYLWAEFNQDDVIHLMGPETMPAAGVSVLVYSDDGITLLGAGEVMEDGTFSVPVSQPLTGSELVLLAALWVPDFTTDQPVPLSVLRPDSGGAPSIGYHNYWVWNVEIDWDGNAGDLTLKLEDGAGAVFLLLLAREAMKTILDDFLGGDISKLATVAMLWNPGVDWSCGACYSDAPQYALDQAKLADNSVWVSGDPNGSSAWGSPVILHELGHYVARNYSRDDSPGGAHYVGELTSPPFAWSEGWASFYAVSTFSRLLGQVQSLFWDIQQGYSFWVDYDQAAISAGGMLAAPELSLGLDQKLDENWVATMLWHLWDGAELPETEDDGTALGMEGVVSAITSSRFLFQDRGAEGADFVDFVDAALCLSPATAAALLETVITYLGFPHDTTPLCANRPEAPLAMDLSVTPAGNSWLVQATLHVRGRLPAPITLGLSLPSGARLATGSLEATLPDLSLGTAHTHTWLVTGDPSGLYVLARTGDRLGGASAKKAWPQTPLTAAQGLSTKGPDTVPIPPVNFRGIHLDRAIILHRSN